MKALTLSAALTASLFAAGSLQAGEDDTRWYLAPQLSYSYDSDSDRDAVAGPTGEGLGWRVGVGKMLNRWFNAELSFQRGEMPRNESPANAGGNGEWDQYALGLEGQFFFSRNPSFSPFLELGGGWQRTELAGTDSDNGFADIGLGFTSAVTGHGTAIRLDARYRVDFLETSNPAIEDRFEDKIINLGLMIPLGGRPSGYNAVSQQVDGFDNRFYISPMLSYVFADKDRGQTNKALGINGNRLGESDNGYGIQLGLGRHLSKHVDIELKGFYQELKYNTSAMGDQGVFQAGAAIDTMYVITRNPNFSPYVGASLGALRTSLGVDGQQTKTYPFADLGFGFTTQITRHGTALRADVRYRLDPYNNGGVDEVVEYDDIIASLGLVIPIGARPVATPPPPPPPKDSDGDGVVDPRDKCPNTPLGTPVDRNGCELVLDSDADGVPDSRDKCPNTKPGVKVDVSGCAVVVRVDPKPVIKPAPTSELVIVYFDFDKSNLTDQARRKLDGVMSKLRGKPMVVAVATGHTDAKGTVEYNQGLSERRAQAVREYLAKRGVESRQLTTRARSELEPAATNSTKNGRALNRRVEIRVLYK